MNYSLSCSKNTLHVDLRLKGAVEMILVVATSLVMLAAILSVKFDMISIAVVMPVAILGIVAMGAGYISLHNGIELSGGGLPPLFMDGSSAEAVGYIFLRDSTAIFLGGACINFFRNPQKFTHPRKNSVLRNSQGFLLLSKSRQGILVGMSLALEFIFIIGNWRILLFRDTYLIGVPKGSIYGAILYLIPLFSLIGMSLVGKKTRYSYFLSIIISIGFVIEFACASRNFAILVAAAGYFIVARVRKIETKIFAWVVIVVSTAFSLYLVIQFRNLTHHGLIPHLEFLLSNQIFANNFISGLIGNYFVILPVTYLGLSLLTPPGYLATSISPLLGRNTNWYEIAPNLTVENPWTPSGAVAQVANLGRLTEFIVWLGLGIVCQILANSFQRSNKREFYQIFLTASILSASLQFLQYSLRAGVRFLYLAIFVSILSKFFDHDAAKELI